MSKKGAKGLQADVTDLLLRSGKNFVIEAGGVVTPLPNLTRDMEASSALSVPIFDPTLEVLEKTLLSEKFDTHVDGLRFRYTGAIKSGPTVTLNFEDEVVARLRELKGPKSAFRAKQTRANFVCGLVEELEPEVPIFCPQRHEKQPVEARLSPRERKKEQREAKQAGGKGLGNHKGLNIEGVALSPSQKELANTALEIAAEVGAPFKVQVALIAALIDESTLGDGSPQNVLQAEQEVNGEGAPVGTAEEEISGFLTGKPKWTGPGAIAYYNAHPEATFYEIAQEVQASGAGKPTKGAANYGKFADEARQIVEAFTGGSEGTTSETITEPYTFKVGKKETYWGAIQRLAKEVEWRAFVVEGRFFFISEPELSRGQVQLTIEREPGRRHPKTKGIIEVDFEFDTSLPTTEATVTAMAEHWEVRPGGAVTLAGYGPASIGPGDAPEKGAKAGISSAVKASTHEGKGRYLVSRIEVDLTGDPKAREVTVTLVKPTQPLPEKLPSTETKSTASGKGALTSEGMPKGIQEAIEEAERIDAKHYPYESPGMRGTPPPANGPYDCSGVTSRLVYVACGAPKTTLASEELSHFGEPGEGEWMTIYAHGPNGPSGHALCRLKTKEGWKYFATSDENPGGGAGWVKDSYYGPGYFDAFSARHPKGF